MLLKRSKHLVRDLANIAQMAFGKPVHIEWSKKDRYGRVIGKVFVAQEDPTRFLSTDSRCRVGATCKGACLALQEIRAGSSRQKIRRIYAEAEVVAQKKKIGHMVRRKCNSSLGF